MKTLLIKSIILIVLSFNVSIFAKGNDSLNYAISFNYYRDLSDTYGGGGLFSGEFTIYKSWYGAGINYGHFHSEYTFLFKVPYDEIGQILEIPIQEMTSMQIGTLSGFLRPIQKKWIAVDLIFGVGFGKAQNIYIKNIDYSYNLDENRFTYLYRDYQLVKRTHFGYQVGLNISIYVLPKIGLQLSSRIQDLSNGGTFFFVGAGLCFRL